MLTVQPGSKPGSSVGLRPRQLDLNQNATRGICVIVENTSILDATGVTLSVSCCRPGLRADSASWPIGSCTVNSNRVDCTASTFGAQASTSLSLGLTALAEGAGNIAFDMSAAEADADPSNNATNSTVNVGAVEEDDSGSGSIGWLFLLLLLPATIARGRKKLL